MYVHTKYKCYTLLRENLRSPSYFGDTYNQSSHTGTGLQLQSPWTLESGL